MPKRQNMDDLSSDYILAGFMEDGTVTVVLSQDDDTTLELLELLTTAIEQNIEREGQYIQ